MLCDRITGKVSKKNEFEIIRKFIFLIYSCILYRIHKPRRSAVAELPPHLVRITSVHAKREWGFMKIKLFSCKTPPRTYARALAALATQGQLRDQPAPYSCLQLQGLSLSLRYTEGWVGRYRVFDREYSYILRK